MDREALPDERDVAAPMHFKAPPWPTFEPLEGAGVRLEPLRAAEHAAELYAALARADNSMWDYLPYGPFPSEEAYAAWAREREGVADPLLFAVRARGSGRAVGVVGFLSIRPAHGVIEVGHLCFSPELKRSRASTEALYLLVRWAFASGYRRCEWKCNALNVASRRAAQRLGFSFEGVFRQHMVVKDRSRDTAWFALTDGDWSRVGPAIAAWLRDDNFDASGQQLASLSHLTAPLRVASDPALATLSA